MPVKEADPAAKSLDDAWAGAMNAPARPREAAAPAEVDKDAPHGRDADGQPIAKYGLNKDGSIRKGPAGRPRKDSDERARTIDAEPGQEPDKPETRTKLDPHDYTAALMGAGEMVWFGGSVLAKAGPKVPLFGRFIPGQKLAASMALFDQERPVLASAMNLAAQHDAKARALAEKLSSADGSWALTCMFMVTPFVQAMSAIWQGDKALAEHETSLAELAKRNEDALDAYFEKFKAQALQAQAAAQQQLEAEMRAAMAQDSPNGQVLAAAVTA